MFLRNRQESLAKRMRLDRVSWPLLPGSGAEEMRKEDNPRSGAVTGAGWPTLERFESTSKDTALLRMPFDTDSLFNR
jgi:hypothetical protein